MPRQNRIDKLRHHRFIVANDARKEFLAPLQFANQISAQLVLDGDALVTTFYEFPQGLCFFHNCSISYERIPDPKAIALRISRTAVSNPTNTARETMLWPILNSVISPMPATAPTLRTVSP